MHLFNWLVPKKKAVEGLVMRISTVDQVDYATVTNPSDSDIWDALVQLPVSYDQCRVCIPTSCQRHPYSLF